MSRYNRYGGYNNYGSRGGDEKQIKRDFMNYADAKTKKINEDGYIKMGKTLGIDIYTDIFMTYFAFKCGCENMEFIKENEYIKGLQSFGANNLGEVKNKIITIREELLNIYTQEFRDFYNYLFDLNVPGILQEKKKKSISFDVVEVYFNSLFANQFKIVKEFLDFLKAKKVGLKWDEWRMYLDFLQNEGSKFPQDYNAADNYPIIIDQFYYDYCKRHGIKIPELEDEF